MPFLRFFMPPNSELPEPGSGEMALVYQRYISRFDNASKFSFNALRKGRVLLSSNKQPEGVVDHVADQMDDNVIVVDYNPSNCILSDPLFSAAPYKDQLIELLRGRSKERSGSPGTKHSSK